MSGFLRLLPAELQGSIEANVNKSMLQRYLICGAVADGQTRLFCNSQRGQAEDISAVVDCLTALGARIGRDQQGYLVQPILKAEAQPVCDCRESGACLRFLLPLCCCIAGGGVFTGTGRLPERPIIPLIDALAEHGIRFTGDTLPFACAGIPAGGVWQLPGHISSQFISGLLLSLPLHREENQIRLLTEPVSGPYLELTIAALSRFGVEIRQQQDGYLIPGNQRFHSPGSLPVEGDWSGAGFLLAAGAIGGPVTLTGLNADSRQGDAEICRYLQQMGAILSWEGSRLTVRRGQLRGIEADLSQQPDLLPVLAATAVFAEGESRFTGCARLRWKESDRLNAMAQLINGLGGNARAEEDSLTVTPSPLPGGFADVPDHRMAMAAALLAAYAQGPVTLSHGDSVGKSYPDFWQDYNALGGKAAGL